jgi:hypothetical protein
MMKKTVLAAWIAFLLAAPLAAQDKKEELLGPDTWPVTVDAVVADMIARLPEDFKAKLRGKEQKDIVTYFGFPLWVRNYYGLWRGNNALIEDACGKPCHPDNASGIIIDRFLAELAATPAKD